MTLLAVGIAIALLLNLATLAVGLPWAYAIVQLEIAKAQGVYATPEEGMEARLRTGYPDAERIEIERSGPNSFDGSHPHVWYVIGRAWLTGPKARPQGHGGGSYFLRVREGWVYIPEGVLPELIGLCMEVFGIS
jgi:hypothetical protein